MALNKESLAWLASVLGSTVEDISAKIASEKEEGFRLPQGEFFTADDLSSRDKQKYKEGKEAGEEIPVKKMKEKYGYDFAGKDLETFLSHHDEALKTKYTKGDNDRIKDLEASLAKQKEVYESEIGGLKQSLTEVSSKYEREAVRSRLMSVMPKETTIKADAIMTLFNAAHEIAKEEDQIVVKRGGEILRDEKSAKPLSVEQIFSTFVVDEGYAKGPDGRGGGNKFVGSAAYANVKSPEEFQRQWIKDNPGKSTASPEFDQEYAKWRKDGQAA